MDKLIGFKQILNYRKTHFSEIDEAWDNYDSFYIPESILNQASRVDEILKATDKYRAVVHAKYVMPKNHRIYKSDVQHAIKECVLQATPRKVPNIRKFVNPKNHNQTLNQIQAKNYLLKSAKVYGKLAYQTIMNSHLVLPKQKQYMKAHSAITQVNSNSYHMANNVVNNAVWCVADDPQTEMPNTETKHFMGGICMLPMSVETYLSKELMDINLARGVMYLPKFAVHQAVLDNINNSKLMDSSGSGCDAETKCHHKLTRLEESVFNKLSDAYETSTEPKHDIDYSNKERAFAKVIIKITNQMLNNTGNNKEEQHAIFNGIITKNDIQNWNSKDKKLFNANQKLWTKLYKLGVAPIPEYTPGTVSKHNVSRIGYMSYIIKHVAEHDFDKKAIDTCMNIAKQRA